MTRMRSLRLFGTVVAAVLLGAGCFGPAPGGGGGGGGGGNPGGGTPPAAQPCTGTFSMTRGSETFTEIDPTTYDVTVPGEFHNNTNRRYVLIAFSLWIVYDGTTVVGPAGVVDDTSDEFSNLNAQPNLEADPGEVVPFQLELHVTFPSEAEVGFGDPWTSFALYGLAPGEPPCS